MKRAAAAVTFALALIVNLAFLALPRGSYDAIVVHHSASSKGDFRDIRRYHLTRGWFEIAYHFVLSNGSTSVPSGHLEPTWRYRLGIWSVATRSVRYNLGALHLCVVGNYEETPLPPSLQGPVGHAVRALQHRFDIPDSGVVLHRDCGSTACPGRHVTRSRVLAWSDAAESNTSSQVREQHLRALERQVLTPWHYSLLWIAVDGLFLVGWWRWGSLGRQSQRNATIGSTPAARRAGT